jgi:hypothetical protein
MPFDVRCSSSFIVWEEVGLGVFFEGATCNRLPSIKCTTRARWAKVALGAVHPHLGCSRTLGQPSGHRLALVSWWLGLGASPAGALVQFCIWVGFCICFAWLRLLENVFQWIPRLVLVKHICTKTCGNVSCKVLCLSFGSHIFFIMFKCWRYKCALRTANKLPHT